MNLSMEVSSFSSDIFTIEWLKNLYSVHVFFHFHYDLKFIYVCLHFIAQHRQFLDLTQCGQMKCKSIFKNLNIGIFNFYAAVSISISTSFQSSSIISLISTDCGYFRFEQNVEVSNTQTTQNSGKLVHKIIFPKAYLHKLLLTDFCF